MPDKPSIKDFFADDIIEYFEYLDDLRESGDTNMWGAGAYLEAAFDLHRREAGPILLAWMDTFNADETPAERAKTALAKVA